VRGRRRGHRTRRDVRRCPAVIGSRVLRRRSERVRLDVGSWRVVAIVLVASLAVSDVRLAGRVEPLLRTICTFHTVALIGHHATLARLRTTYVDSTVPIHLLASRIVLSSWVRTLWLHTEDSISRIV